MGWLLALRQYQLGGLALEPDDLPLWMWADLGLVKEMIDNHMAAAQRVSLF